MQSVRLMGWISMFMAFAIMGMGGAPIAEKFGLVWLDYGLQGIAYISVAVLSVAAIVVGGLGMWHGILVILGKEVGAAPKAKPRPLPSRPAVEGPEDDPGA